MRLFDAIGGGGAITLLTDGKEIYARTDERAVLQSSARTQPAAAGRRERKHAEGTEAEDALEDPRKKKAGASP